MRWQTVWAACESDERVARLAVAGPDVVVVADKGGAIQARRAGDGSPVAAPTYTGIPGIVGLAAWRDGAAVRVATGAGSRHKSHRWLQRWDLVAREEIQPAIDFNSMRVKHIYSAVVGGEQVLVVVHRGVLAIRRVTDGSVAAEVVKHRETSRVVLGSVDGEPIAISSSHERHAQLFRLADLVAPERLPAGRDGEFVDAMAGTRLLCGSYAEPWDAWRTAWARDLSGNRLGPEVTGEVITAVAIAEWPAVYIARADRTVSLIDMESGAELCPALRLPARARSLAVMADAAGSRERPDVVVGFGLEVARFRPPSP
ncbi:hypothetical protein Ade02nite_89490 [Paractinoplanes deccanensis]|uniref:Uncharacterized protein n=1 Tax=Paractinoplanes deccanensis TaxID=113561 RepID=A0ABQ3YJZ4_9ACTN|nr:hypothetical protein [Actinoplanes deccanensis]GID80308.1 hypothetical protein Ade02nite_89490 [Actinoplanes deccanensis]